MFVSGLLLAGYGVLIATRVLAHERFIIGVLLLASGAVLAWHGRPRSGGPLPRAREAGGHACRAWLVTAFGVTAAGGVLAYNALAASTLSPPEVAIVAYGVGLIAAARFLTKRVAGTDVGNLVAWSFPLVAAPLGLWALDALINAYQGGSPVDRVIEITLVVPLAWTLGVLGYTVDTTGQALLMDTPRGLLALGIGLVCAGLHPGVLFLGVFAFHAWRERTPALRLTALLALGLAGVYAANLLRLLALAAIGHAWGGDALQTAHAHAGWIIFVGWMILYWWLVLSRFHGDRGVTFT
jgi:exosortase/archaeosortase family protein